MLREMTARQLDEWKAYFGLEPWGTSVLDTEFAHFKAIYTNCHAKKGRSYKTDQFRIYKERQEDLDSLYDQADEI